MGEGWNIEYHRWDARWNSTVHQPATCEETVTKLGHNTLPQSSREPWPTSGGSQHWNPSYSTSFIWHRCISSTCVMCAQSIQEAFMAGCDTFGHQKWVERKLEVGSGGQLFPSGRPPQFGNQVLIFRDDSGPCLTMSGLHRVTVVSVRRNGTRQPLICVLVVKSKRCTTLSTFVLCRSQMAACCNYTLLMMKLLLGWLADMALNAHARRRRRLPRIIRLWYGLSIIPSHIGILCGYGELTAYRDGLLACITSCKCCRYTDGELSLRYTNGSSCHSRYHRETVILLHCNFSAG